MNDSARWPVPVLVVLSLLAIAMNASAVVRPPPEMTLDGVPPISDDIADSLEIYRNSRAARLIGWFGDGIVISTRFADVVQLHWVTQAMGRREQLTFGNEPVRFAAVGPDPAHGLVFGSDTGGGEEYHLLHLAPLSTTLNQLTKDGTRNTDPVFSRDGSFVAYSTTATNGRDSHIHLLDMSTGQSRPLLERTGTWYPLDFSPDDRKLLAAQFISIAHIKLYEIDITRGRAIWLDNESIAVSQTQAAYSPDGSLWFLSNLHTEYRTLRHRNMETGEVTDYTLEGFPHDVERFAVSHNGNTVAFVVNEQGYDRLHLLDVPKNHAAKNARFLPIPESLNSAATRISELEFSKDNKRLALSLSSPSMPGDVFVLNLRDKRLERWTHSELGGLSNQGLSDPELIEFATFDRDSKTGQRRTIPAFYYRPNSRFAGARPVVVNLHGGPESQARPVFNSLLHFLTNEMGVAVIYPNVRGSSGYGKTYLELDDVFRREDAVRDIGALLDWVSTRPELDKERVALMGGSYGGYLVMASMIRFAQSIRAGIDLVGISNFLTFLETTRPYRRDLRRAEYGDERKPQIRAFLGRISPLRQASRIKAPLLVVQGANDPRVPVTESEQLVKEVRENGGEVWYLLANNEGHGFRRKPNRDFYQSVVAEFLNRHLLGTKVDLPEGEPSLLGPAENP